MTIRDKPDTAVHIEQGWLQRVSRRREFTEAQEREGRSLHDITKLTTTAQQQECTI